MGRPGDVLTFIGQRARLSAIAVAAACLAAASMLVARADANHSVIEHVTPGEPGQITGNGSFFTSFQGASADGSRVFFHTDEQLVAGDTDAQTDVYERSGGQGTLISAGQVNGNGAFDALFSGVSADGTRVFFETDEQLVAGDTDTDTDIYERSGGQTTLVSAGQVNGNGPFDAQFFGASADGTRVFFQTSEQLVAGDTDSQREVYERSGGQTTQVSVGQINGNDSEQAEFQGASEDGSRVFFRTDEQLVAADTDTFRDLYERSGGQTTLVSVGQINGNGPFGLLFMDASADGTRVSFISEEQLVAGDTDAEVDIYERSGGQTTLVSAGQVNGNGVFPASFAGASADGSRVFFHTDEQLVAGDTDAQADVYERSGGQTTLVSVGQINGNGPENAFFTGTSADGSRVFFGTPEQLVAADSDAASDIYQRSGGQTTLVSAGQVNGNGPESAFFTGASADGSRVFFETGEPLVAADTDAAFDVYQRSGGQTTLVSAGQINGNGAFGAGFEGASADGTRVFFRTDEQLVAGDTDSITDIYERSGGQTTRVSAGQVDGGNGAFDSDFAGASADGSRIFFETSEALINADGDDQRDVYERSGGQTTLVSAGQINGNGQTAADFQGSSADGSRVFFTTGESLVASDTDGVDDVYQRSGGQTTLVSAGQINGNGSFHAAFAGASADGSRVFITTTEPLVGGDSDTADDVYERSGGLTTRVSTGNGPNTAVFKGASADGSRVFFETSEKLVAADSDVQFDIYERSGGQTTLVSAGQVNGNGTFPAFFRSASADGSRVIFDTDEKLDPDDADSVRDIYQRSGGQTTLVSAGEINGNGSEDANFTGASPDGTRVVFFTFEQLATADTDAEVDVYERSGGQTTLVSAGQINGNGGFGAFPAGTSTDGSRVYFETLEPLVAADSDSSFDLYQRSGGQTTLVSAGQVNGNGAFDASFAGASADGSRAFFRTEEQLVAADTDSAPDIYERSGGQTTQVSTGQINGNDAFGAIFNDVSTDGSRVVFTTAEQLVADDSDTRDDIYSASIPAPVDPPVDPPPGGGGGGGGGGGADTTAPDTTITAGPKAKEKKGNASVEFSSTEAGSTFECSLDDGAFAPCSSPHSLKVKKGRHSFAVRARDAAGNVDSTPATRSWTVKKKKKKKK